MEIIIKLDDAQQIEALEKAAEASGAKDTTEYLNRRIQSEAVEAVKTYVNICPSCKRPL